VVIQTKACGICHTDVGFFEDKKYTEPMTLPVVLGHEIAGEIVTVADDVTDYAVGDRVTIWSLGELHCGVRDGGFGEFVASKTETLVPIPRNISFEHAVFAGLGMTANSAVVVRGHVKPGQEVGIIGFGVLGHVRIQLQRGLHVRVA
jgi:propanol-preferring alcohol dehydrogenase